MTLADDQPNEEVDAAETPEETPAETREETADERLDALGADIQRVRQETEDPIDQEDRQFIDRGDQGPVDDTIAPPG